MPAKEPFHAQKKSQKNVDKTKHEILLTSKNVDETKGKLKRAGSQSASDKKASAKEFIVDNGIESTQLRVDLDASKSSTMRSESALRASRLYGDNYEDNTADMSANALFLNEKSTLPKSKKYLSGVTNFIGLLLTVVWGGVVAGYVNEYIGWEEMSSLQPHIMGGFLAGILAPIAFLWFILHLFQRGTEINRYTEGLRIEMQNMLFPSEEARQVLQKDMQGLCEQAAELSLFSKTMLGSIHKARTGLKEDVAALEKMGGQSQRHFDSLAQSLTERSKKLLALTEEIEARTNNIELKSLSGAEAWDETTLKILERVSDIEARMQHGAEQISQATSRAQKETKTAHTEISKTVASIDDQASKMEDRLGALNVSVNENQKELTLTTDLFASDTKRLSDLLESQMISLQDLEGVSQKTMGIMQQTMEQNAKQQEVLSEELQDRIIELSTIAEMAQEKTSNVGNTFKGQTQNIVRELDAAQNALEDKIDTATQNLKVREYAIAQSLENTAEKISDGIDQAAEVLADKHGDISQALNKHVNDVGAAIDQAADSLISKQDDIAGRLDKHARTAAQSIDVAIDVLGVKQRSVAETLDKATSAVEVAVDKAQAKVSQMQEALFERFEETSRSLASNVDIIVDAIAIKQDDIATKLEERSDALTKSVEVAKDDIRRAEDALFERHENIHQDFKKTYARLSASVVDAKSMMSGLDQGMERERVRLNSTVEKFKADQELLESLLQEHAVSTNSIEGAVGKTLELTRELLLEDTSNQEQFMANLEGKVVSLKEASNMIDVQASDASKALGKLGVAQDILMKQSGLLTKVAKQAEEDLGQLEGALYNKQEEARKQADIILNDLSDVDQAFNDRLPALLSQSQDVKDSLKAVSTEIEKNSVLLDQKLKSQAAKVEHLSRHSVDTMSDSLGSLAETLVQIGGMVEGVQDSIDQSANKFSDKAKQLTSISKDASVAVEQASSIFAKRSESMHKTAAVTSENVKKLQETQQQMRQEVFMGAAKFVMESLHSLAVDLTRAIDGGIHERMWKAYNNGDIGIFTSYLVSIEDELPVDDYQQKFIKDPEFRNYIKSFINQYEDMIDQSIKVDNGALLATTFSTSDVGKLYRLLCVIADTAPLTQVKETSVL
ncbi:MAG: hypothetical protein CMH31_06305 [Micavibrio sp.]|nr:hypothetical protein [Micavibrio sp.]